MKKLAIAAILFLSVRSLCFANEVVERAPFGHVSVYPPERTSAAQVVIMVSGDGGWRGTVLPMAEYLKTKNCLVAGIDIREYFASLKRRRDDCSNLTQDFSDLARFLEEKYGIAANQKPLLIGYSSGATLVYGTIVEAPQGTFLGAISFGFCPDLPLNKPFCEGNGLEWTAGRQGHGLWLLPARNLQTPWYAFQGLTDRVCDEEKTAEYVSKVPIGKFVLLPKVGHGFHKTQNWIDEFDGVLSELVKPQSNDETK
jgi:pimeloyl-ACP methyl ester carboxylesterase